MPTNPIADYGALVEPDRVHKAVYADEEVYEAELKNIFHKKWIYIGHVSQGHRLCRGIETSSPVDGPGSICINDG